MARIVPVESELSGGGRAAVPGDAFWHSVLNCEWAWKSRPGGVYALYQEMEDKDAHLFSTLQTRKNALLACGWKMVAAGDSPELQAQARFVEETLRAVPDLDSVLFQLLDALAKGFSVGEVIWKVDPGTGRTTVSAIHPRFQGRFAFDDSGALYHLTDEAPASPRSTPELLRGGGLNRLVPRPGEPAVYSVAARRMPSRKFLHFAFQPVFGSPYGTSLCARAYWYYWFKKTTLKCWSVFNEKYGAPTAVARYGTGTTESEQQRLAEVMETLHSNAGILVPEGVSLELLEARRSSASNTYRDFADWCNDEISKLVLGQTLTTSEGRRSGSLALGRVHEAVRADYLAADARALAAVVSGQLVRWIVDFNFGPSTPAPQLVFDCSSAAEFKQELELDRELVKMGVPLPSRYFYEKYRRPAPVPGERGLRYDDANLYQYHLQFGVLTINEVRASLGLDPVPWGGRPPATSGSAGSAAQLESRRVDRADDDPGNEQDVDETRGEQRRK